MPAIAHFGRVRGVTYLLVASFLVLVGRLVDIQVIRHDELARKAREKTTYVCWLEPRRGDILDRNGHLLATSTFVKTVCANPKLMVGHQAELIPILAPLLEMKAEELAQKLAPHPLLNKDHQPKTETNGDVIMVTNQYVVLKHRVPRENWELIQAALKSMPIPGLETAKGTNFQALKDHYSQLKNHSVFTEDVDEQLRLYPSGSLAAHVLGYVSTGVETNSGPDFNSIFGRDGIELRLDSQLRGVRGWRVSERDSQRRELLVHRKEDVEPRDGLNAVLTIDSVIQHIVESALVEAMKTYTPTSISCIVAKPKTGEILAMATLPTYDPNNPGEKGSEANLKNRIVMDLHEPGSTFKIVVVSGALNEHKVKLTDKFDCMQGRFEYAGRILHDHEPYGLLSVQEIITKSSNIGAAKIGLVMGPEMLYEYIHKFGFGSSTRVLPGESAGMAFPPEGLDSVRHPGYGKWSKLSITHIPMGHEIGVTSMQMMMAMCAVANKGVLMEPMLVDRLVRRDGTVAVQNHPKVAWPVISEEAATDMVTALKSVVTSDGTAVAAAMTNYTVAGKTGTAQKSNGKKGYFSDKFYSSFIGFFPADNPELCIYVSLDDPKGEHYGGKSAAPVFHQIAEKAANYLNIVPDKGNPSGVPEVPPYQTGPLLRTASLGAGSILGH